MPPIVLSGWSPDLFLFCCFEIYRNKQKKFSWKITLKHRTTPVLSLILISANIGAKLVTPTKKRISTSRYEESRSPTTTTTPRPPRFFLHWNLISPRLVSALVWNWRRFSHLGVSVCLSVLFAKILDGLQRRSSWLKAAASSSPIWLTEDMAWQINWGRAKNSLDTFSAVQLLLLLHSYSYS